MKQRVKIITVDPAKRNIEAMLKEGSAIQLQVWDVPPIFRWPRQGEFWTVERTGNYWTLGTLLEHPESEVRIEQLSEGEALITADQIRTETGGYVVTSDLPATQTETFRTGDIKMGAYAAPDPGWLACDGAPHLRADYPALFTKMGGAASPYGIPDGTHFNAPDFRGRGPAGVGTGDASGATAHALGDKVGKQTHVLSEAEMPAHSHTLTANSVAVPQTSPTTNVWNPAAPNAAMAQATDSKGSSAAHENRTPSTVVNFFIKT